MTTLFAAALGGSILGFPLFLLQSYAARGRRK